MYSRRGCPMPTRFPAAFALALLLPAACKAGEIDFNRDVRPILAEFCFSCHGFDEKGRKAGLRLDVAESAYAANDGVAAIVPGHPDRSEAVRRILSDDPA